MRRNRVFNNIRHDLDVYGGDWSSQGFWAMLVYRFGRWRYGFKMAVIRKPLSLVYKLLYKVVQIAAGIELPCEVPVGRNFRIDHFGGIIISTIADNVDIGANAVVLQDVPANSLAVGVPARIISKKSYTHDNHDSIPGHLAGTATRN